MTPSPAASSPPSLAATASSTPTPSYPTTLPAPTADTAGGAYLSRGYILIGKARVLARETHRNATKLVSFLAHTPPSS